MKYFILAGEASGDLHGSYLVEQLKILDPEAEFEGWGGDLLIAQGVKIRKHIKELAFMGFVEVIQNLKTIKRNFVDCKKQILDYNPDVVIYVDYPGFNIRMAKWVKEQNIKSLYFISPNVWAWKASRVYKIRDYTDRMYTILPFEKEFYAKHGIEVEYFGHPLVDVINTYKPRKIEDFRKNNNLSSKPIIALMAGSRKQEIKHMLPIMIEVANQFPKYEFIVTGAPAIDKDFYEQIIENNEVRVIFDKTYEILTHSIAGLITSGTATLEAALFELPQVVCYKGGKVSVAIAKMVANIKYISLVNLILDKPAVTELIQNDLNVSNIISELKKILPNGENSAELHNDYVSLYKELDQPGVYSRIAANMNKRISE